MWKSRGRGRLPMRPMPAWASGRRRPASQVRRPLRLRRPGRLATPILLGLLLAVVSWLSGPEPAFTARDVPLVGWAGHVVDGDTLDIEGQRVRLFGLDAPEIGQTCTDAAGAQWPCGAAARAGLRELVGGRQLRCNAGGHDRYGRLLATCHAGETDIAAAMVLEGLAVGTAYPAEQASARSARRGIWQGSFAEPAAWRRGEAVAAAPGAPNPSRIDRFLAWVATLMGD